MLVFALYLSPQSAKAEPITVAVLGDSLVEGYGLPKPDGFVPQLENWLTENGQDVTLINAGVSGDTTSGGVSRIDWTLTPDVDAIIVSLGANDMLRGLDPALSRQNLDKILTVVQGKNQPVMLIGIQAPNNFGADYKRDFESIYPDLAKQYDTLLYANFVGALFTDSDMGAMLEKYFQADGIHPNAVGVKRIVNDMGPTVVELIGQVQKP